MADNEEKEKRIREIRRRLIQIKIQMDRLRQAAFLDPKATGSNRYHQQQAKKDLDRLTEEHDTLTKELEELTGESKEEKS